MKKNIYLLLILSFLAVNLAFSQTPAVITSVKDVGNTGFSEDFEITFKTQHPNLEHRIIFSRHELTLEKAKTLKYYLYHSFIPGDSICTVHPIIYKDAQDSTLAGYAECKYIVYILIKQGDSYALSEETDYYQLEYIRNITVDDANNLNNIWGEAKSRHQIIKLYAASGKYTVNLDFYESVIGEYRERIGNSRSPKNQWHRS